MSTKTLAEDMRDWALERDINYRFDGFPELVTRAEKLEAEAKHWHGWADKCAQVADEQVEHVEKLEASAKHWQRVAEGLTAKLYELEALLARIPK